MCVCVCVCVCVNRTAHRLFGYTVSRCIILTCAGVPLRTMRPLCAPHVGHCDSTMKTLWVVCALGSVALAQQTPSIVRAGGNLNVNAPFGDVTLSTQTASCTASSLCGINVCIACTIVMGHGSRMVMPQPICALYIYLRVFLSLILCVGVDVCVCGLCHTGTCSTQAQLTTMAGTIADLQRAMTAAQGQIAQQQTTIQNLQPNTSQATLTANSASTDVRIM